MDKSGMLPSSSIGISIAVLERAAALHAPHPVVVVNNTSSSSESDEGKEREKKKKKKSKKKRKSHREEKKKRKGRDDSEERGRKKKRQKSDDSDERRGRKKKREDGEDSGEGRERKKRREEKDVENRRRRDDREKNSVERRRSDGERHSDVEERGHDSERRGERERRSTVVDDLDLERREGAGTSEQSSRDNDKPVLHKRTPTTNVRPKDDEAEVHSPVLPPGVAAEEHLIRNNDSHQRPDSDSSQVVFDCLPPIPLPPDRPAEDGRREENHDPLPPVPPSSELKKKSENANEELFSMMKDMVHWKCKANVLQRQVDQQKNEMSQLQNKVLSSEQDKLAWVNAYNSLKKLSDRDQQTHETTITELRGQVTKLEGQVAELEVENTLHRNANETVCFDYHALENEKKELERENAQLIAEKEELERKLNGRGETTSYNRVDPQYRAREPTREPSSQCVGIIPDYSSDVDNGTTSRATRSRTLSRENHKLPDVDNGTTSRATRSRTLSRENHKLPKRVESKAPSRNQNRREEYRPDEQPSGSKSGPPPQLNNNNENMEPVAASMVSVPQRPQPRPVASEGHGRGGRQWMGNNAPVYPCTLAPVYHPELGEEDYQQVPSVSHRSHTEQTTSHSRPVPPNMNTLSSSSHPHVSTGTSDTLAPPCPLPLPSAPYTVVSNGQVIRYNRRPPPRRRLDTSGPNGLPTQPVVQNDSIPPVAPLAGREVPIRTGSSMPSGAGPREEVHSPDSTTVSSEVPHHQIEPTPEPVEKAAKPHQSIRPRLQTTAPGTGRRPPPRARGQARTAGGHGDESSKVKNVSRRSVSFVDPNDLPPLPANQDSCGRRVGPPRRGGRPTNPAPAGILKKKPADVAAQNAPDVFTLEDPQTSIKRTSTSAKKPVTERVDILPILKNGKSDPDDSDDQILRISHVFSP